MPDPQSTNLPTLASNGQSLTIAEEQSRELAFLIAKAADDRKGGDITILRVADVSYLADYFVLVTGFSNVQVRAISRTIEDVTEEKLQRHPLRIEGISESSWILQDYGDVIVHIFLPQEREFYNLEAFWGHGERIYFSELADQN